MFQLHLTDISDISYVIYGITVATAAQTKYTTLAAIMSMTPVPHARYLTMIRLDNEC
jgi:hypothetical protein